MADLEFVEVVATGPGWNKVKASDGNVYTFKGDYNWRSNNPGNIEYGPFAISQGAIGSGKPPPGRKRGFAIFPSYEAGEKARTVLQFESPSYKDKTISQAISRYAPPSENDTKGYANAVAAAAGVSTSTKMSELTPQQRQAFLAAQRRVEGFRPGKISGEAGKPVPSSVVQQFRGKPLPPTNVGPPPVPAIRSASLSAAQQATVPTFAPPPPPRRPALPSDRQPLPIPAPLNLPPIRTALLPSGKPVEAGRTYQIGGQTYIGGIDTKGAGMLRKADAGILGEAGSGSMVGGIVDRTIRDATASGLQQVRPAASSVFSSIGSGASDLAGRVGGMFGGGQPSAVARQPQQQTRQASLGPPQFTNWESDYAKLLSKAPRPARLPGRPVNPTITMEFERRGSQLRPFDPSVNTPRQNPDGSQSTEVSRTVQIDGKWANVPSLWWGGDQPRDFGSMSDDQLADFAGRYERHSGQQFPRFDSVQSAETAARQRSALGAGTHSPLAAPRRPITPVPQRTAPPVPQRTASLVPQQTIVGREPRPERLEGRPFMQAGPALPALPAPLPRPHTDAIRARSSMAAIPETEAERMFKQSQFGMPPLPRPRPQFPPAPQQLAPRPMPRLVRPQAPLSITIGGGNRQAPTPMPRLNRAPAPMTPVNRLRSQGYSPQAAYEAANQQAQQRAIANSRDPQRASSRASLASRFGFD